MNTETPTTINLDDREVLFFFEHCLAAWIKGGRDLEAWSEVREELLNTATLGEFLDVVRGHFNFVPYD